MPPKITFPPGTVSIARPWIKETVANNLVDPTWFFPHSIGTGGGTGFQTAKASPICIPVPMTFAGLANACAAAVGTEYIRMALYRAAPSTFYPGEVIAETAPTLLATGTNRYQFSTPTSAPITLEPGYYWVAMAASDSNNSMYNYATPGISPWGAGTLAGSTIYRNHVSWAHGDPSVVAFTNFPPIAVQSGTAMPRVGIYV